MKVIVIGAGPGALQDFTGRAMEAMRKCDLILTSRRLAGVVEKLQGLACTVKIMGVTDTIEYVNANALSEKCICVLASGDTGFYSIAGTIARNVSREVSLEFISGSSSLSYFAAKLKTSYEDMKLVSLHGREGSIIPHVCYNRRVFALTGGTMGVKDVINSLQEAGLGDVMVYVGEKLSTEEERIVSGRVSSLLKETFSEPAVVITENDNYVNRYKTLRDDDFVRGKSPMTKEAIRNLVLAALAVRPEDVVYDIGAGTGSVSCALAYKAFESTVYAIEKEAEAVTLIEKNKAKTGAANIVTLHAKAPEGLADLPPANKVFIGGSTGNLKEIIQLVSMKNEEAVFVITAVTLETLSQAVTVLKELAMDMDVTCANISTAHPLGSYHLMKAENPVYIIKGAKNFEK